MALWTRAVPCVETTTNDDLLHLADQNDSIGLRNAQLLQKICHAPGVLLHTLHILYLIDVEVDFRISAAIFGIMNNQIQIIESSKFNTETPQHGIMYTEPPNRQPLVSILI